jgi:hypothetical protein
MIRLNRMVRFSAAAALVALALPSAASAVPGSDASTKSKAINEAILAALGQEIERSMKNLHIEGAVNPYFIGYKVTEVEVFDVVASLGATTSERSRHFVLLEAHVHVGSYKFDNSNFVFPRREVVDGIAQISLPLEATPDLARRSAWIATDAAYKEALEQIRAKQDALGSGASGGLSNVPSYTKEEPVVMTEAVLVPALEGLEHMRKRAEQLSNLFRGRDAIRDSRVAFTSFLERRWLLNSEGTRVHDTRRVSGVAMVASSQAEDGQELARTFTSYGLTEVDLPDDKALEKEAKQLADTLAKLRKAPLIEAYTGPVLFEGPGAVGIVRETLTRHLSGTPLPVGLSDQDAKRFGGELVGRVNLRVIAPILSLIDDPTAAKAKKQRLIGSYRTDDEGVAAQKIQVIVDGKLKNLLMSRTPSEGQVRSNGHARLSMPGGVFRGSSTNLFVSGKGGVPRAQLRKKLLAEAKAAGLSYGLVIRQLDDSALTANPDLSRFRLFQLLSTIDRDAPPIALLAYKLHPNGREELVRGVQLKPVGLRAWKDVIGVSSEVTAMNYLNSTDDPFVQRLSGGDDGYVPSSGIESSVVTPDLLFRELDVKPSAAGRRPHPAVLAP